LTSSKIKRHLSKSPFEQPSVFTEEFEAQRLRRNKNIIMNPDGIGKDILPGNYVVKKHPKTGQDRKVLLEHEKGYFWAIKVRESRLVPLLLLCQVFIDQ
jgi:hypothetical protein